MPGAEAAPTVEPAAEDIGRTVEAAFLGQHGHETEEVTRLANGVRTNAVVHRLPLTLQRRRRARQDVRRQPAREPPTELRSPTLRARSQGRGSGGCLGVAGVGWHLVAFAREPSASRPRSAGDLPDEEKWRGAHARVLGIRNPPSAREPAWPLSLLGCAYEARTNFECAVFTRSTSARAAISC